MDDATRSVHDNGRDAEFLLLYLTRDEVHYIARRLRWQLGRVEADADCFVTALLGSESRDEREVYEVAVEEFRNEADKIGAVLREFRRAWRRPTVTEIS